MRRLRPIGMSPVTIVSVTLAILVLVAAAAEGQATRTFTLRAGHYGNPGAFFAEEQHFADIQNAPPAAPTLGEVFQGLTPRLSSFPTSRWCSPSSCHKLGPLQGGDMETINERFRRLHPRSMELFERAKALFPHGVTHDTEFCAIAHFPWLSITLYCPPGRGCRGEFCALSTRSAS